jgi:hypothetical protein
MLRRESSSRMWIGAVNGLLAMGYIYSQSTERDKITSIPLPLRLATQDYILADSFGELKERLEGRSCRIRHAERVRIEY